MSKITDEIEDIDDIDDIEDAVEHIKKMSPHKKRLIKWMAVIVGCLIVGGISGWKLHAYFTEDKSPSIDYIPSKLENASELTTQTITYTARVPMEEGSIPFITKKSSVMYYDATLRAGVNLSDVEPIERGNKIIIKVPHATIQGTPNIEPNSLKFYDQKKALLNWNEKEDVAEALQKAKEDLNENPSIDITMLLTKADEHAEELIHELLDDIYDDREIEVRFK